MSEADLAPVVADWLRQSGYAVHSETMVPTGEEGRRRKVDMIGFAARELCAVELKQNLSHDLLDQAHSCMGYAERIWLAVASSPHTGGDTFRLAAMNGFGIMRVTNEVQIIEPAARLPVNQERRNLWLDALAHSEASDDAGRPNLAGEGWRQKCLPKVLDYWRKNEKRGNWRECWDQIENGFRSAAEMKKAFRKAVKEQA